jgi:N-acetyltransferase
MTTDFVAPVPLTGRHWVRLEPLNAGHADEFAAAADDDEDLWFTSAPTRSSAHAWVRRMQELRARDGGVTYVVRRLDDGALLGTSSYLNVDAVNRRLEIGHTWYAPGARRTGINTETKLVMLGHAFDELDCVAVEFRTHFFNTTSRAAIERLGAKLDGVLRSHQLLADGSRRDTVVYSILDIEWPAVANNLRHRLQRNR